MTLEQKKDRLWKKYLDGKLTLEEWADAVNKIDPPPSHSKSQIETTELDK